MMSDTNRSRARLVGLNHVALEVGDLDVAIEFYEGIFDFEIRGRLDSAVFLDMGDQFLAIMEADSLDSEDERRHFGLVVDDPEIVESRSMSSASRRFPTISGSSTTRPKFRRSSSLSSESASMIARN